MNRVAEAVSHSRRLSGIQESPYERVLPTHIRDQLLKRPQVVPKSPQVAPKPPPVTPKPPQVRAEIDNYNVALWAIFVAVILVGVVIVTSQLPRVTQAVPVPTPTPAPAVVPPRAELLRAVPRAQLLALPNWRVGQQTLLRMPDGLQVLAKLKGSVFSTSQLPVTGNHVGDTWVVGDNHEWVWLTAPGSSQATWIDP